MLRLGKSFTFLPFTGGDNPALHVLGLRARHIVASKEAFSAHCHANDPEDWRFRVSQVLVDAVETGRLANICPYCGARVYAQHSLPVIQDLFGPACFYPYSCCREHLLIFGMQPYQPIALVVPVQEDTVAVISLLDYHNPGYRSGWGIEKFGLILNGCKALIGQDTAAVENYLAATTQRPTSLLVGLQENMGHFVREEAPLVYRYYQRRDPLAKLLLGPFNFFDAFATFKASGEELPGDSSIVTGTFEKVITENRFVVRLTGDARRDVEFSQALQRGSIVAVTRAVRTALAKLSGRWPVLWITLRQGKRSWPNEAEGISCMLNRILQEYPHTAIVFDGLPECEDTQNAIVDELRGDFAWASGLGWSLQDSLAAFQAVDLYVMPLSNSSTFTFLSTKPGVSHAPEGWYSPGDQDLLPGAGSIPTTVVVGRRLEDDHPHDVLYDVSPADLTDAVLAILSAHSPTNELFLG